MKKLLASAMMALLLLCSSCASMFSGTLNTVRINADEPGRYTIQNATTGEIVAKGKIPGRERLKGGEGSNAADYLITYEREGFEPEEKNIRGEIKGLFWLNIALLPFFHIGMIIDCASGGMWELPKQVSF